MKKYIVLLLLSGAYGLLSAQQPIHTDSVPSSLLSPGYGISVSDTTSSYSTAGVGSEAFANSPEIDIAKALYGKIAGLNVSQGTGSSAYNLSSLTIHGHAPLVLIDGFPRNLEEITAVEIESCIILKDAAASALYGVRGANGVVLITTKRGKIDRLSISAKYQFGISTQFRSPEFADAYTYAQHLNSALRTDGLNPRYNHWELEAFRNHTYPNEYPDVDWWNETMNNTGTNHRLDLTFTGGNERFRHYTSLNYYHDQSMLIANQEDDRFDTSPTDVRLNLRTNLDVSITSSTAMKFGLMAKLQEYNGAKVGEDIFKAIYATPSAAFPIKYSNGIFGGNSIYTNTNPVALLTSGGHSKSIYSTLLADLSLKQELDAVTPGLSATLSIAFDNCGGMYEGSSKEYRYIDPGASITQDGTLTTQPHIYGKDSEVLSHSQGFSSLYIRSDFQAKLAYSRIFGKVHNVGANLIYDQQSYTANGRNKGKKRQSLLANATYIYKGKYIINGVINYSGTAYLPKGDRFHTYPAISAAWVISNEDFLKPISFINLLKIRASYGISGWDGNLQHELYRQAYGAGGSYYFGNNAAQAWGLAEGSLPVEGLTVEKSQKTTVGFDLQAFRNRLSVSVDGFFEKRSDMLVPGSNSVSSVIGIGVGQLCAGINKYKGLDASIAWEDKLGNWGYGIGANMSYINSEVVNDNQAFQEYDYLYHKGNKVGQMYGLEAIGFFQDQLEINNSPVQTYSTVRPGDIKYKDQNGDNKIDDKDMVKMFGTDSPQFYFGFNLKLSYKRLELTADFQGVTGVTTNLLNSPLYTPLVNNGNISKTFLERETPWSDTDKQHATVPRLTTLANSNNYHNNSLWYRDASFLKLRNVRIGYTFPKSQTRFADLQVYAQGTNLFSLDNIDFADPENLAYGYPSTRAYWAGVIFNF